MEKQDDSFFDGVVSKQIVVPLPDDDQLIIRPGERFKYLKKSDKTVEIMTEFEFVAELDLTLAALHLTEKQK